MKTKLTKVLKQEWLEALKSGKYVQGKAQLKHKGKYCCLGVICDIHPKRVRAEKAVNKIIDELKQLNK